MFGVDWERTLAFTIAAETDLDLGRFARRILVKWTQERTTLSTIELDIFQLWKDATPSCYHTRNANEIIEIGATQIPQGGAEREVADANVDLRVDTLVCREIYKNGIQSHFIEYLEHGSRCGGEEVAENGLGRGEVDKGYLQ